MSATAVTVFAAVMISLIFIALSPLGKPQTYVDLDVDTKEDPILLKKGQSRTITLNVLAPRDIPLNLKIETVALYEEVNNQSREVEGLITKLDKDVIIIPAESTKELAIRDRFQLELTPKEEMKEGTYKLFMLVTSTNNGTATNMIEKHIRVQVL